MNRKPHTGFVTDESLANVAAVYRTALATGQFPVRAVARHFGWSVDFAGGRVQNARRRGFLPPTTPGRAKG